jgi:DNA repair exonuclease SbcCD ATPase subunit
MSIKLIKNDKPILPICKMNCDKELNNNLNQYELTKFLNKSQSTMIIGKMGSGKTSLLYALFKNNKPTLLKNVFENIFLFQPKESSNSMSDKIFHDNLPDENLFYDLTEETLNEVFTRIKDENDEYDNEINHCIIIDDFTAHLRENQGIKNLLKEMLMNRRHIHLSLFFIVQSYKSVEPDIRKLIDNFFIYKTSKQGLEQIFNEIIELPTKYIYPISNLVFDAKYNFLFINTDTKKMFKNWDEIIIED